MFFTIIIFIIMLTVLVVAHEFGHFFTAKKFGMYVEEFAIGFPPRIFSWMRKGTRVNINAIPLGGYVKIPGENGEEYLTEDEKKSISPEQLFSRKSAWKRIVVLCAGVGMNIIVGWLLLVPVFVHGINPEVVIMSVSKNSPAFGSGMEVGDVIKGFSTTEAFVREMQNNAGKETNIIIERNGISKVITTIPRTHPPTGEGALGVSLSESGIPALSFLDALGQSALFAFKIFGAIFVLLFKLIGSLFGFISGDLLQSLTGPVGVFQATAQASAMGWTHILYLAAMISLNLAAVNIFPFPALDGGRVFMVIVEKIKQSPVSSKTQSIINTIGFLLLICLLLFISIRDVIRIW